MLVQVKTEADVQAVDKHTEVENVQYQHTTYDEALANNLEEQEISGNNQPIIREGVKVGRNDPCPCGSGKKYKQCHGVLS
jgi:preprotein translocase subunit SecA